MAKRSWRRVWRWVGLGLGLIACIPLGLAARGQWLRTRTFDVAASALTIPSGDAEAIARGRHLAHAVLMCAECHGEDFGGKVVIDGLPFARVVAPNVTSGPLDYEASDWDRAVRHGVDRDGHPLAMMPSDGFATLSDADLAALVAYLTSLPPVERALPETEVGPIGLVALGAGAFPLPALEIDHDAVGQAAPEPAATAEYGRYLVEISGCRSCHGPSFEGRSFGPNQASAPPLTPEALEGWSSAELARAVREGIGRDGRRLDPLMPSTSFAGLSDMEVAALWAFFRGR